MTQRNVYQWVKEFQVAEQVSPMKTALTISSLWLYTQPQPLCASGVRKLM